MAPTDTRIADIVKGLHLKELRAQLRGRGMSPGGSEEELRQRLRDYMASTGITTLLKYQQPGQTGAEEDGYLKNNYARPGGNQNLGNRISDRSSSRVLAPPGGKSQITFGDASPPPAPAPRAAAAATGHMTDASDLYTRITTMGDIPPPSRGGVEDAPYAPPSPYGSAPQQTQGGQPPSLTSGAPALQSYGGPAASGPAPPQPQPQQNMSAVDLDGLFRGLQIKDLRSECRSRGLNPGGGLEVLKERVKEHMQTSGNFTLAPTN